MHTPTDKDFDRADRVQEAAEELAETIPGIRNAVCPVATMPELIDGVPTWTIEAEDRHNAGAAQIVVEERDGELVARVAKTYRYSVGSPDEFGDEYHVDRDGALESARVQSTRRSDVLAVYRMGEHEPLALVRDGTVFLHELLNAPAILRPA